MASLNKQPNGGYAVQLVGTWHAPFDLVQVV